jgi:hypothetical protein
MRLTFAVTLIAASVSAGAAFTPTSSSRWGVSNVALYSTVENKPSAKPSSTAEALLKRIEDAVGSTTEEETPTRPGIIPPSADEINARLEAQLAKLREKDLGSRQLSKEVGFINFKCKNLMRIERFLLACVCGEKRRGTTGEDTLFYFFMIQFSRICSLSISGSYYCLRG